MSTRYPKDRAKCELKDGPADRRFRISGGTLLYNPERDARFPYIYSVKTHKLVHDERITKILIHVVDTSIEARIDLATFHKTLEVPLGPNELMDRYGRRIGYFHIYIFNIPLSSGLFELETGTILFARPLCEDGNYDEKNDVAEAWCLDG